MKNSFLFCFCLNIILYKYTNISKKEEEELIYKKLIN